MATVTLTVTRCASGGHVNVLINETGYRFSIESEDILDRRYSALRKLNVADADLVLQIIGVVKTVTAPRTAAKIKSAVEAATFEYVDKNT
jgi:hypothetical protein